MIGFLFAVASQIPRPLYADREPLAIRSVTGPKTAPVYGVEELEVDAHGTYDNPFDPSEVALGAVVQCPSGLKQSVPGFLYRPFKRSLVNGKEALQPAGAAGWRVRICPEEAGEYLVRITFRDRDAHFLRVREFRFTAVRSDDPGLVQVSKLDHSYFAFKGGRSFFPIGANICWGNDPGTFSYDRWLPRFAAEGCNYFRVWLAPYWVTFAMERSGRPEDGGGIGRFDLGDLWRLDYVLNEATRQNMYVMLCLDSFNELQTEGYATWKEQPVNRANGGPLAAPKDFWTSQAMLELYQAKLRYLIARFGAYSHVLSWELWNEVDIVHDYDAEAVRRWHEKAATALKVNDPYHHLVTTSFADPDGYLPTFQLPSIDYSQTHIYSPDFVAGIARQELRKAALGKPHYVGEVGADAGGPGMADKAGIAVHDPLWISLATGCAGGGMSWWWDSLIEKNDLYHLYGAFKRFTAGIDFPQEGFHRRQATLRYADPHVHPAPHDLVLEGGPVSWSPSDANLPQKISVKNGVVSGRAPSGILHGLRNHPNLHNPLTIDIDEPKPTTLLIGIREVSTYGGATLSVTIDGRSAIHREFDAGEENKNPAAGHKFDGEIPVAIPAGAHKVAIDDRGNDWLLVGYRIPDIVPSTAPPLNVWALVGKRTAIGWVQQTGMNWHSVVVEKRMPKPTLPAIVRIPGLPNGRWIAEIWDTWKGAVTSRTRVRVTDHIGEVRLPAVTNDLAIKLRAGGSVVSRRASD